GSLVAAGRARVSTSRPRAALPLLPYTTLFRSKGSAISRERRRRRCDDPARRWFDRPEPCTRARPACPRVRRRGCRRTRRRRSHPDQKSTRLNSSHVKISYAVFCLKKQTDGKAV